MPAKLGIFFLGMTVGGATFLATGLAAFLTISQLPPAAYWAVFARVVTDRIMADSDQGQRNRQSRDKSRHRKH